MRDIPISKCLSHRCTEPGRGGGVGPERRSIALASFVTQPRSAGYGHKDRHVRAAHSSGGLRGGQPARAVRQEWQPLGETGASAPLTDGRRRSAVASSGRSRSVGPGRHRRRPPPRQAPRSQLSRSSGGAYVSPRRRRAAPGHVSRPGYRDTSPAA